jgi:hypothetical protein
MQSIIALFGIPEDVTGLGFRGKAFCFPVTVIDREYLGTPRQISKSVLFKIIAEISRSRLSTWDLGEDEIVKVLFEISKERLISVLNSIGWRGEDLVVQINTDTHKGACPFDSSIIQNPAGAVLQVEIKRPIGFLG